MRRLDALKIAWEYSFRTDEVSPHDLFWHKVVSLNIRVSKRHPEKYPLRRREDDVVADGMTAALTENVSTAPTHGHHQERDGNQTHPCDNKRWTYHRPPPEASSNERCMCSLRYGGILYTHVDLSNRAQAQTFQHAFHSSQTF